MWGAIIGAGASLVGQHLSNRQNKASAKSTQSFQEAMSGTAYQRAADDLERAGLNRILALGGPASTPTGVTPHAENIGAAATSGAESGAKASMEKLNKKLAVAQEAQTLSSAKQADAQAAQTNFQTNIAGPAEVQRVLQETRSAKANADLLESQKPWETKKYDLLNKAAELGTEVTSSAAKSIRNKQKSNKSFLQRAQDWMTNRSNKLKQRPVR